jgi:nicotinamidase-related amidase
VKSALLVVDMINAFDFDGAGLLLRQARRMLLTLVRLKERANRAGCPVIYCNDNFGEWRSDFRSLLEQCIAEDRPGRNVVLRVAPEPHDYFVLKPKHSAFYETPLQSLLKKLGTKRVILCGIAGDGCIHSTATDAHIREFHVVIARDATASQTAARNRTALAHLEAAKYSTVCAAARVRF